MKIFISADMEGVAGVSAREEVTFGSPEYGAAQKQMTAEVAAAMEGAFEAGADEVWVKDAHWTGRNLLAESLPNPPGKTVRLVRGWSGHPFSMVQELDGTFQGLCFIGYHSAASRAGNPLAHTLSSRTLARVTINERVASEAYLFGLAAATVGVPLLFTAGDEALCREVRGLDESIRTVATMRGVGPSVVACPPGEAAASIRREVAAAVRARAPKPLALPDAFQVRLTFRDPADAYRKSFYPGARLTESQELAFEAREFFEVLRLLKFMTF